MKRKREFVAKTTFFFSHMTNLRSILWKRMVSKNHGFSSHMTGLSALLIADWSWLVTVISHLKGEWCGVTSLFSSTYQSSSLCTVTQKRDDGIQVALGHHAAACGEKPRESQNAHIQHAIQYPESGLSTSIVLVRSQKKENWSTSTDT